MQQHGEFDHTYGEVWQHQTSGSATVKWEGPRVSSWCWWNIILQTRGVQHSMQLDCECETKQKNAASMFFFFFYLVLFEWKNLLMVDNKHGRFSMISSHSLGMFGFGDYVDAMAAATRVLRNTLSNNYDTPGSRAKIQQMAEGSKRKGNASIIVIFPCELFWTEKLDYCRNNSTGKR